MDKIKFNGKAVWMTLLGIILVIFFGWMLYLAGAWVYNQVYPSTTDVTQSYNQGCPCNCKEHHTAIIKPKPVPAPKPKPIPTPKPVCQSGTYGIYPNCYYPQPTPNPQPTPQTPIGPPPFSDPTPINVPSQPQPQPNPSYGQTPYSDPTPQSGTTYNSGSTGGVPYSDSGGGSSSGIGPQPNPSY